MIRPPLATSVGGTNTNEPGNEQLLGHAGMCRRVEPALRERHVSRGRYEFPKLRVGHLVAIDPEAVDAHEVREALLRPMALGTHEEGTAADEHHPGGVVILRRQAGIGGATSRLAACRVLLRESESAEH
jgi:hypothetical protein